MDFFDDDNSRCKMTPSEILAKLKWRVYLILTCQIAVSSFLVYSFLHFESLNSVLKNNLDVLYIAEITGMVCLFFMNTYEEIRCDQPCGSPVNFVTLFIYTISLALNASGTMMTYTTEQLKSGVTITALVFLTLTKYAPCSDINFAFISGGAVFFSFIFRFISYVFSGQHLTILLLHLFSFFLTCVDILGDTQALDFIQCEDYILSCSNLYFNMLNMLLLTLTMSTMSLYEQSSYSDRVIQYITTKLYF